MNDESKVKPIELREVAVLEGSVTKKLEEVREEDTRRNYAMVGQSATETEVKISLHGYVFLRGPDKSQGQCCGGSEFGTIDISVRGTEALKLLQGGKNIRITIEEYD